MLSFIHRSLVVILPKISNYTRTRIELLYNQGFHPAGIFKTLRRVTSEPFRHHSLNQEAASYWLRSKFTSLGETEKAVCGSKSFQRPTDASAKIRKKLAKRGILVSSSTVRRSLMTMIRTGLCFVFSGIKPNLKSLFLRVFLIVCIRDLTPAEDLSCIS